MSVKRMKPPTGDNRHGVRVPGCHGFAAGDLLAITFRRRQRHKERALFGTTGSSIGFGSVLRGSDNGLPLGSATDFTLLNDATFVLWMHVPAAARLVRRCGCAASSAGTSSPMDCAAITPIASPLLIECVRAGHDRNVRAYARSVAGIRRGTR